VRRIWWLIGVVIIALVAAGIAWRGRPWEVGLPAELALLREYRPQYYRTTTRVLGTGRTYPTLLLRMDTPAQAFARRLKERFASDRDWKVFTQKDSYSVVLVKGSPPAGAHPVRGKMEVIASDVRGRILAVTVTDYEHPCSPLDLWLREHLRSW
jgi:hypothetical protein